MEPGWVNDFGARWQDAVNRKAIDEVIALCAPSVRLEDPALPEPVVGADAVRRFYHRIWTAFPELRFSRPDPGYLVAPGAPVAAARWAAQGTMLGELDPPGYAPTNGRVEFRGVDVWRFDGSLVAQWESIYDVAGIGRQIGALPPPGTAAERVGVRFQRLAARRLRRRSGN